MYQNLLEDPPCGRAIVQEVDIGGKWGKIEQINRLFDLRFEAGLKSEPVCDSAMQFKFHGLDVGQGRELCDVEVSWHGSQNHLEYDARTYNALRV